MVYLKKMSISRVLGFMMFLSFIFFTINHLGARKNKYSIGDVGPAGGIVFYDKGDNSDGWRYMEASTKAVGRAVWGCYRYSMGGTGGKTVGSGRENTINHVEHFLTGGASWMTGSCLQRMSWNYSIIILLLPV